MIRTILVILLLNTFCLVYTQTPVLDSLTLLLSKSNKGEQAKILNQIGLLHFNKTEYNKAIDTFKKALLLAERSNSQNTELNALKEISRTSYYLNDADQALEFALKLEHKAKAYKSDLNLGHAYAYIARIKGQLVKDTQGARKTTEKAILHYQKANYRKGLISAYNDLAITYLEEENDLESIEQYKKALKIAEELQLSSTIRLLKSNIAGSYLNLENYKLAYRYNKEALSIPSHYESETMIIYDHLLMSMLQLEAGKVDSAIINGIYGKNQAESAQRYDDLQWSYEVLIDAYKEKGNLVKALDIAEKAMMLKDSLNHSEITTRLEEKEAEIILLNKNQEILALEKAAERQRLIRNGIILFTLSALLFVFLLYKRKRLLVKLQEKELIHLTSIKDMEDKEKKMLKEKLSYQERVLASKTMHIIQKNEVLTELKHSISNLINDSTSIQPQITKLSRTIDSNINFDKDWERFKLHFDKIHPHFFESIKLKYPNLKNTDIRFCAYIKMGLSTKEIAQLMGINATSIQKARYRLKKKMDLDKSINLIEFISGNF